jgi:hypothetical protein
MRGDTELLTYASLRAERSYVRAVHPGLAVAPVPHQRLVRALQKRIRSAAGTTQVSKWPTATIGLLTLRTHGVRSSSCTRSASSHRVNGGRSLRAWGATWAAERGRARVAGGGGVRRAAGL